MCGAGDSTRLKVFLQKYPLSVFTVRIDGTTPLHTAAVNNNTSAIRLLLEYNANINSVDNSDKTPFDAAVSNCAIEAALVLLENGANTMPGAVLERNLISDIHKQRN